MGALSLQLICAEQTHPGGSSARFALCAVDRLVGVVLGVSTGLGQALVKQPPLI